ncbi:hypothetical protein [Phaffia rhodozyma]|uniref:Uncharacterized protein n=1 Tax=Phaffia rhodozyma TaxID=264483 RepID=A0A0F7SQG8_PHARH|nr:hypothetical protein [Phaffia rhodozyma]
MEEHLLTPLNREHASTDSFLDSADDHLSLRTRRKPVLTRRRLLILIAILVVLGISGGAVYLVFSVARYFWRLVFDPHRGTTVSYPWNAVTSYYGGDIPQFDVVASVFVRLGKELPGIRDGRSFGGPDPETSRFGDWQPLYSQVVFSRISLNSADPVFKKTINLSIPLDVLSQFYEPNTFFPEIVNTFVIVPSDPDPILNSLEQSQVKMVEYVEMMEFEQSSPFFSGMNSTSRTKSSLQQLARPIDPLADDPNGSSHMENVSRSLNAFYDSGAVREFALRPVIDERATWDQSDWAEIYSQPPSRSKESENLRNQRQFLPYQRNASLKIKSRSWLSMAKETPMYDYDRYTRKRRDVNSEGWKMIYQQDPLNWAAHLTHFPFSVVGHYRSLITQHFNVKDRHEFSGGPWSHRPEKISFYGPYMTLRGHAAGSEDWIPLPRIDQSSNNQSDPFTVPWHITFDLLSKSKIIGIDKINKDDFRWFDRYRSYYPSFDNGYMEASTLQTMDFINAIFGNSHTYTKRPILRSVFFVIGGLIRYPLGIILQTYYLFSRSLSTGLSLPSTILYLCFGSLYEAISYHNDRYDYERSAWMFAAVLVINIVSIWRWTCLWCGIGITWHGCGGSFPIGFKRFGRTHSERMSRRSDQKFTWAQKGVFVAILTIILTYLPELPHLIGPTYLPVSVNNHRYWGPPGFRQTLSNWSETLRLPKYGTSLKTSLSMLAVLSQVLLNWRLGTFAGSIPAFAWTQVVGTIISWTPTVFHTIFGKFHATDPLEISVVVRFCIDLVILWQAVNLPTVNQEEEEDE